MKKLLLVFVLLMGISVFLSADLDFSQAKTQVGFDLPTIAKVNHSENGAITSLIGANLGFGISYKKYFQPLEPEKFNPYWGVGTFAIIVPYVQVGGDYVFKNGLYIGGGLIYLAPEVHFGLFF